MNQFKLNIFSGVDVNSFGVSDYVSILVPHPDWTNSQELFKQIIQPLLELTEPLDIIQWATNYSHGCLSDRYTMRAGGDVNLLAVAVENAQYEWVNGNHFTPFCRVEATNPEVLDGFNVVRQNKLSDIHIVDIDVKDEEDFDNLLIMMKVYDLCGYHVTDKMFRPRPL